MYWCSWPYLPGETTDERFARIQAYLAEREDADLQQVRSKSARFAKRAGIQRKPCCVCGATKSEMHHPSYKYWYLISFLCRSCHVKEHYKRLDVAIKVEDLRVLAAATVPA